MSIRLVCLSALFFVVLSGCAARDSVVEEPPATEATKTPAQQDEPGATSPSPKVARPAGGVRVAISSHCGVSSAWVDGELWLASPPLGGHNPPPGWDENETVGLFVVTAPGRAEFHGDGGQTARFRIAEPGTADPNAGCE